jgi:hypothetical protein
VLKDVTKPTGNSNTANGRNGGLTIHSRTLVPLEKIPKKDRFAVEIMRKRRDAMEKTAGTPSAGAASSGGGKTGAGDSDGLCQRLSSANDFMICPVDPQCSKNPDASSWFTYLGRSWDYCTTGDAAKGGMGGVVAA